MKRFAAAIMAALFSLPLGSAAETPKQTGPAPAVLRTTLANGMKVVLLPNRLAPVATTVMTYGAGSDDDTMPGLAHATEHMMFRGTKDVSAAQFAIMAARAGAQYDAETQNTDTTYYFTLPSAYAGLALRLEADRMNGALMRERDWKSERGAIEQEVRAHQSVPGAAIIGKMRKAFFGDTPYARDGVGTIASFNKMRASDIAAFYHTWYRPNNATLVVAGDIDPAKTLAEIRRDFGAIPAAPLPAHKSYAIGALRAKTLQDSVAELPLPVGAAVYRFPSLSSPDYAAGEVLEAALQNGRGALTDLQVEGKLLGDLAVSGAYRDVGIISVVGIGLPGSTPQSVEASLQSALDGYRRSGVPNDLIAAAKTRLLSAQDYRQASISGLAFTWADSLALTGQSPDAVYAAIQKVTPADVNRVLRTYMVPSDAVTVLMQPKALAAAPHTDAGSIAENVRYHPQKEVALPVWAAHYFRAPLRVPQSDSDVSVFHLPNGMTLAVRPERFSPTVVVRGDVRTAPDLYEPRGKAGVAQIADALLPWGTTTYDRLQYDAQLDDIAADVDLGTSFGVTVQAKNFDRAMQLLADGELHPAFPANAFALIKNNTARTLAAVADQPRTLAQIAQIDALYPPGDPRRRRPTPKSVEGVTPADVGAWYHFAYRPDLTTMAIVGDVSAQQARTAVEKYFGAWRAHGKKPSFKYPVVKQRKVKSVTVTSPSSTHSQVTLTQVINVHRGNSDAIALELANTMLSDEGTGSMLFRDLRTDRGYVYDVESSMDIGRSSSMFSIDFASDAKNVAKAQAAALSDIRRLQTTPVPAIELQRAKALLLAERILPLDSYNGIASDILDSARAGLSVAEEDAFWSKLLRTTPSQVRDAMRRWISPSKFSRVIMAPGN